ncbi:hypothetical protein CGLO_09119 [Colletotrichum gloeosporioides Cg-14]|uniref:F-box domain-containing protein n=1 Tax=Colletotrichum gloeosporioides (strain Cg-14) TaxID=1237896 RepID=T0LT13_COLGC|nr:hypothetical protein CGLO_09119 [Colletotrichum gloeosporioides Cg-14]
MVKITELPCEVITEILEQGTARSIVAAAHSCRYIRNCFFERPSLAGRVILRQIPERLLPYAVAALYADTLPIPRTETMVHDLIDKLCPALIPASISLVRFLGLGNLSRLEDRHNIIHAMALDYANEAWDFMQTTNMRVPSPGTLQLSENEYLRFCRAFYRVEIFHSVGRPKPVGPFQPHAWNDGKYYLDAIPAYDREQIACVLEYQERLLLNSVQEVLAHDVAMGHIGVNYVRAHDDSVIQNWLALGLRFLVKITGDLSYDEKKRLLHSNYGPGELIDLWKSTDMARNWLDVDDKLGDDPWIRNKKGKLVHVFRRSVDAMDLDRGPREAFLRSILGPTPIDFISCHGLRDRAYVLWDMDRLVQLEAGWTRAAPTGSPDTFQIFVDEPQPSRLSLSLRQAPADKALEESFQARKEIWDKGGSGYWSADDLSKVVWGGERWAPYKLPEDW